MMSHTWFETSSSTNQNQLRSEIFSWHFNLAFLSLTINYFQHVSANTGNCLQSRRRKRILLIRWHEIHKRSTGLFSTDKHLWCTSLNLQDWFMSRLLPSWHQQPCVCVWVQTCMSVCGQWLCRPLLCILSDSVYMFVLCNGQYVLLCLISAVWPAVNQSPSLRL